MTRACADADVVAAEFDRLWAQPVRSWPDVLARAEACEFWHLRDEQTNRIEGANSPHFDERSVAHLVEAVLELARR
jgi:hypothetical protein